MDWTQVGVIITAIGLLTAWMNRRFDKLEDSISNAHTRIDATIASGNAIAAEINNRLDATNARIDVTQGIIMRMLEKQGK